MTAGDATGATTDNAAGAAGCESAGAEGAPRLEVRLRADGESDWIAPGAALTQVNAVGAARAAQAAAASGTRPGRGSPSR